MTFEEWWNSKEAEWLLGRDKMYYRLAWDAATTAAAAEEREACARMAEVCVAAAPTCTWIACQRSIAAAIRARSQK